MTWIRIRSWNRIHFFQCKSRIQIRIKINWILNTGYHSIFVSKGFQAVFRIHLIFMAIRIRILDPHWKKWIQIPVISLRLTEFFTKTEFLSFCLIFMLKLDDPLRNQEILIISLFSIVQIWVLGVKFFFQFLVAILPLGSGSLVPHIFADLDPDPGSQNFADPKH